MTEHTYPPPLDAAVYRRYLRFQIEHEPVVNRAAGKAAHAGKRFGIAPQSHEMSVRCLMAAHRAFRYISRQRARAT